MFKIKTGDLLQSLQEFKWFYVPKTLGTLESVSLSAVDGYLCFDAHKSGVDLHRVLVGESGDLEEVGSLIDDLLSAVKRLSDTKIEWVILETKEYDRSRQLVVEPLGEVMPVGYVKPRQKIKWEKEEHIIPFECAEKALKHCVPTMSTDPSKIHLQSLLIDGARMVSTDGRCLHAHGILTDGKAVTDKSFVIDASLIRLWSRLRSDLHFQIGADDLEIAENVRCSWNNNAWEAMSKYNHTYPDYQKIVPDWDDLPYVFTVDRKWLIKALTELRKIQISLKIKSPVVGLMLSAEDQALGIWIDAREHTGTKMKSIKTYRTVPVQGAETTEFKNSGIDGRYLRRALQNMDDDRITIGWTFRVHREDNVGMLPMRIEGEIADALIMGISDFHCQPPI